LQIYFRFDHDDFLHTFFELRSISRHFGYFRATDVDLVHPVFLLKAFLAVHERYGDNAGQNKAKKSVQGALEAKLEVQIWRRPIFLTQRPRLSILRKVGQSTQLLPVLQIHFRFDHGDVLHPFFELRSISRHFGHFYKYFQFLNCTSGPQI